VRIQLVTPAPLRINNGNKITALRWATILRQLGHRVRVTQSYDGEPCDLLIALHARRSYPSIRCFHVQHPELPLIVALTGTDLYRDIRNNQKARHSLELAKRLVVLQNMALVELPKRLHGKTRVIYQSAQPIKSRKPSWNKGPFKICMIGHLRSEKDPLRIALATRKLPSASRIKVIHIGRALDESLKYRALAEMNRNPRYRWVGELSHPKTRSILAGSHLLVITSRMEGSSNALSEALASRVPVIASKIPGLMGTLGNAYPGFFPVADTRKLTALLEKAETNHTFYELLQRTCERFTPLVKPMGEIKAWKRLLLELSRLH
jgi:putative glycosyltransferase (TIGR04348 family)